MDIIFHIRFLRGKHHTGGVPDDHSRSQRRGLPEILAQTRHFVRTAVVPREQEILAGDRVPDDLREQAKKMGLFGYAIPQEWGGLGLDVAQDVELAMELGYTSLALRSMFGTNNGIAGQVLVGSAPTSRSGMAGGDRLG